MTRITIDIEPALHRAIRDAAKAGNVTVQTFMLDALTNHLRQKANSQDTAEIFAISVPALQRDWDNEYDAIYDELG